jgi:hypothetical protein
MEPVVPSVPSQPLIEDAGILAVVDDFESIYDVPFVTVNRVGSEIQAEVILSGVKEIDEDRLNTAQSVAGELGYRAYARVFGDLYDSTVVTIHFSDNPASGLIWALETEMVDDWSQ